MTAGRHRLDGQRRDALRAWITRHIPPIPFSRRAHPRAAGGATGPAPTAGAPAEVPASDGAPVRPAGTSHLWPGGPVTAPAGSKRRNGQQSARAPQPPDAAPEGVTAPAAPGAAARPPWVTWHGPPGTPPPAPRLAPGRDTTAMPAVDAAPRVRYAVAAEAWRDRPVNP